ncbi:SRPBCC family protein [Aegicerativicinus sediminis]
MSLEKMATKHSQNTDATFGIYHDLTIDVTPEKLFAAIAQPEHLINWWPKKCLGTPVLGSQYNFFFSPEYNWFGEVVKFDVNQSFHIKMTKSDVDWDPTTFGFEIREEKGKSVLQFTHLNWKERNSHFRIASFCWAMLLKGLKDYVEKGIILPFEERS